MTETSTETTSTARTPNLGVIFPPDQPPEQLREVARAADRANLDQLWLWEDCFKESGIATAGAVLGWTERIAVGIGLLPVPLRNVALTAMELATLERLFPRRIVPGIGHGVLSWMGQVGARAESPMTLLREYADALQRLLHGERLDVSGRYVTLTDVALDWPPQTPPPVLIGAERPKTAALAGELGDGLILTGETDADKAAPLIATTTEAADAAGRPVPRFVSFLNVDGNAGSDAIAAAVRERASWGVTDVALLQTGDDVPALADFASRLGAEVLPALS